MLPSEAASWLCYAASVLSGTTTMVEMWRFMDGSARATTHIGNRLVMVSYVGTHPDYACFDRLDDTQALLERWHGKDGGRIHAWVGLEHLVYTDEAGRRRVVELATRFDTGLSTPFAEGELEAAEVMRQFGRRPVQALEQLGVLEPARALLAHCVWLEDADIETIARHSVAVAHYPVSNMKLASAAARVTELPAAGVAVGPGTDGGTENNNFDMFEEMKTPSLLAKLSQLDATALDTTALDAWTRCTWPGSRVRAASD